MKVQLGRSPSNSIIRIEIKKIAFVFDRSMHAISSNAITIPQAPFIFRFRFRIAKPMTNLMKFRYEIKIQDTISSNSIIFEKISLAYSSSRNLSNFARETIGKIDFEIVCDPKNESLRRKIYSSPRGHLFLCFSRCFRRTKRCIVYLMHR